MNVISTPPRTPSALRQETTPYRDNLPRRSLNFGSPTASPAPLEHPRFIPREGSVAHSDSETLPGCGEPSKVKQTHSTQKVETSFRAFLASFPAVETATKTKASYKMPPPMKKGSQSRMTLEQRIELLREADIKPEKLTFIQAAYNAANSMGGLQCVGSGTFSDVYVETANGAAPATVKKVFKEFSSTSGTLRPLQGTTRLYDLALACEKQYLQIREAHNGGQFPIDALPILNLSLWRLEGAIRQPFMTKMFQPSWDTLVAKINVYGKNAQITDQEEQLLRTIQDVFKRSTELGLCIDFKPDNLGLITVQEIEKIVIIDTFGLSGNESSDIVPMNRANIKEFF